MFTRFHNGCPRSSSEYAFVSLVFRMVLRAGASPTSHIWGVKSNFDPDTREAHSIRSILSYRPREILVETQNLEKSTFDLPQQKLVDLGTTLPLCLPTYVNYTRAGIGGQIVQQHTVVGNPLFALGLDSNGQRL